MSTPKNTKDMERAQAAFHKKEVQAREGAAAMAEYKAAATARNANTEKLRALRLAKEAEDARAAVMKAAAKTAAKPAPKSAKAKKRT
jgi:hypothetical protein